jgi:hypothetical protein
MLPQSGQRRFGNKQVTFSRTPRVCDCRRTALKDAATAAHPQSHIRGKGLDPAQSLNAANL